MGMAGFGRRALRCFFVVAVILFLAGQVLAVEVMRPIGSDGVKVGGEIGRRVDITVSNNLMKIDVDNDFLKPIKERSSDKGYIAMGKLIDAAVRFAHHTQDPKVIALKKRIVKEIIDAQLDEGYIGIMVPKHRMWTLWDVHDMAYIIHGLASDYRYFKEKDSLEAARKAGDYLVKEWKENKPADWDKQAGIAEHVGVTGLDQAMVELYRETKDSKYLDFCVEQRGLKEWDTGIVIGRRPMIEGHNYGYLACCVAQLELYRERQDKCLLNQSKNLVKFLVEKEGMTILGSSGQWEIWTNDQDGRGELGESCSTIYTVRFLENLFQLEGKAFYGDLMERTIYNALFALQSIDGRKIRYYTPFEGKRMFWEGDNYCCPGNYRRLIADLPGMIYYLSDGGVTVNLYTQSSAELELDNGVKLKIRQETKYPRSGVVRIYVEPSKAAKFTLNLRVPKWCKNPQAAVNGEKVKGKISGGSFFALKRKWKKDDEVVLDLPMEWRLVKGRERQAGRVAIMRGPVVYCLDPARLKELRPHSVGVHMHYPVTKKMDPADLGRITLDGSSIEGPIVEEVDGKELTACRIKGWGPWVNLNRDRPDMEMVLTEFVDPEGKVTYFRLRDTELAVDDELLGGGKN